jgi:hypothetical protein
MKLIEIAQPKDFDFSGEKLRSLKRLDFPEKVIGSFYCNDNQLTSLEGAPIKVGGIFSCSFNLLTSFDGAPKEVGDDFYGIGNKLTSLEGIHKQIKKMNGTFYAHGNPIKSHVLGLLLIEGLTQITLGNQQVQDILNKHLGKGKAGVLNARQELLDLDLDDYAEL